MADIASCDACSDMLSKVAPEGADIVYDPVGGDLSETALRNVKWNGRYLVVGNTPPLMMPQVCEASKDLHPERFRRSL